MTKITVTSFLGIINMGIPYCNCCIGASTPIFTSQWIYYWKVSLFILGTGQYTPLDPDLFLGLWVLYVIYIACHKITTKIH